MWHCQPDMLSERQSVSVVSTLQRDFSYKGRHGGSYGQFSARVQGLRIFSVQKYVGLLSQFERLQARFPRLRLFLFGWFFFG